MTRKNTFQVELQKFLALEEMCLSDLQNALADASFLLILNKHDTELVELFDLTSEIKLDLQSNSFTNSHAILDSCALVEEIAIILGHAVRGLTTSDTEPAHLAEQVRTFQLRRELIESKLSQMNSSFESRRDTCAKNLQKLLNIVNKHTAKEKGLQAVVSVNCCFVVSTLTVLGNAGATSTRRIGKVG